jgi:hypothetical protein
MVSSSFGSSNKDSQNIPSSSPQEQPLMEIGFIYYEGALLQDSLQTVIQFEFRAFDKFHADLEHPHPLSYPARKLFVPL